MEINLVESFLELFSPNKRIYWIYILSSIFIAFIYLNIYKREQKINFNIKLWLHKSAVLDYKYFIISFFIKTILIVPLVISTKEISLYIYDLLLDNYGFIKITSFSYNQIIILFTLTLFIVSDFTRYWIHRLLHTIPYLWEFHKVHHSAKVLTPITFYRVHPIENILFGFRYALSIGIVTGVFIYLFGAIIGIVEILGVNIFLFLFALAGSNLRHSHIKIRYPNIIEKIIISPFAHQLHHSTKYYNKNFGGYLSIWDNLFGTMQVSKNILDKKEKLQFGIETKDFQNISNLLFMPFIKISKKTKEKHENIF